MKSRQINFRCPEDVAKIFEGAASRSKMTVSTWLIATGLQAAGHSALFEQLERVAPRKKAASARSASGTKRRSSR